MPLNKSYSSLEGTFKSSSPQGSHIFYKHYFSSKWEREREKKRTHIIFQHGMIEYHKRHEEFIEFVMDNYEGAICISVMDLLGHGLSGGERAFVENFNIFLEDYKHFCNLCIEDLYKERDVSTFMMAHSLGALITLRAIGDGHQLKIKPKGVILVSPCIKPKIEIPKYVYLGARELPSPIKSLRLPVVYNAYDLTQDNEKAISFIQDPLISKFITMQLGLETIEASRQIHGLSYFLKSPCLFVLSGDDDVVDVEKTKLFIAGMNKSLVKVLYYKDAKHDILNETCRSEVFQEIMNYIQ